LKQIQIVTIGAYGFTQETFFVALQQAQVDTFCDVRWRRGMRGSLYAFANSERLQHSLQGMGICYLHRRDLAPDPTIRAIQGESDRAYHVLKRERERLEPRFIEAYTRCCLGQFDAPAFIEQLGEEAQVVALFCVEREPDACHRSLLAQYLIKEAGVHVTHLTP
jgi:uncharacterized protein (DUF488 family)